MYPNNISSKTLPQHNILHGKMNAWSDGCKSATSPLGGSRACIVVYLTSKTGFFDFPENDTASGFYYYIVIYLFIYYILISLT